MAWVPKEITENPKIAAVNELLRRHNAGDPDAASFTPDIANELRKRFMSESTSLKDEQKSAMRSIGEYYINRQMDVVAPMKSAIDIVQFVKGAGGDVISGKPLMRQGGTVEQSLLTGQIPRTAAVVGSLIGPAGAGAGAAAGQAAQQGIRNLAGLPPAPQGMISRTLPEFPGKDIAVEGITNTAMAYGGQAAAKYVPKVAQELMNRRYPERWQSFKEELPLIGGWIKGGRKAKESDFSVMKKQAVAEAKENVSALPQVPKVAAAKQYQEAVDTIASDMKASIGKVKPIISQYGNNRVSVEGTRQQMVSMLDRYRMVDAKGNIIPDEISGALPSDIRAQQKYLTYLSDTLQRNPTIYNLDRIRSAVGDLANFKSASPSPAESAYRRLYHTINDDLYAGLDAVTRGSGQAKVVAESRKLYSDTRKLIEPLEKIARQAPEEIAGGVAADFKGTEIQTLIKAQPRLKAPMKEMVLNDLAARAKTPESFQKAIDSYGRDTLQQLLDQKTYAEVVRLENAMFRAWKLRGEKFQMPLGKFWQGVQNMAARGETVRPETVRAMFVSMNNELSKRIPSTENEQGR